MQQITIKAQVKVNEIGKGGHLFYTPDKQKISYLGAWVFDKQHNPISSWVFIDYPGTCKFEPGEKYITDITLIVEDGHIAFFKVGNKFDIQAGILYDGKMWASGEILEIL